MKKFKIIQIYSIQANSKADALQAFAKADDPLNFLDVQFAKEDQPPVGSFGAELKKQLS